jgi:hypothetical protein
MAIVPGVDSCGAPTNADTIYDTLLTGESFDLPSVDLSEFEIPTFDPSQFPALDPIQIADFTTTTVGGAGFFDVVMTTLRTHLEQQFAQGRITGRDYTEVYTANVGAALSTAAQLLLNKDQAYYASVLAQAQAQVAQIEVVKAQIDLEKVKLEYNTLLIQNQTVKADFTAKKLQLALLDADYCIKLQQKRNAGLEGDIHAYNLANTLPAQLALVQAQELGVEADTAIKDFQLTSILPIEQDIKEEQHQTQRAQTLDTRTDGSPILGIMGTQQDLYNQQIESYQRDAEAKVGKMLLDSWITQKTMDEGLAAPGVYNNDNINSFFNSLRARVDIPT